MAFLKVARSVDDVAVVVAAHLGKVGKEPVKKRLFEYDNVFGSKIRLLIESVELEELG